MEENEKIKYLIIHGHFYQPPRENPWTGRIDRQVGATPYHDWNERITRECYMSNTCSRRLDGYGRITSLVNNYEWISFNFGPTILSWLEEKKPSVYEKILEADRASSVRLDGRGNALAQVYNHIIMPLATRRDQETQIEWGVHDFKRRFGREPEGIWLAETAINETTLGILIRFGFRFTVLSPHQAERIRPLDSSSGWKDVSDGSIPTGFPYRCFAPGHRGRRSRSLYTDIFFYDTQLSQDVSFNHLLRNGDKLAEAIVSAYPRCGGDLVVIATDGEIYGHHEPFADMALSYLIDSAAETRGLSMTNFSTYLDDHAPQWEVRLKPGPNGEGTAWSCSHGLGRWKEDCGCNVAAPTGWNQKWRAPLRKGLDSLRDALGEMYEVEGSRLLKEPWKARDDYITLIEKRSFETTEKFFLDHAIQPLSEAERSRALALLESQRYALLMFTSCGWFFNDISGIEAQQLLKYAGRAIDLAGEEHREKLEEILLSELDNAVSNTLGHATGADIYHRAMKQSRVGIPFLVGQHAITSHLFSDEGASEIFKYTFKTIGDFHRTLGERTFKIGCVEVTDPSTLETSTCQYLLVVKKHTGFTCFVKSGSSKEDYEGLKEYILGLSGNEDEETILKTAADHFEGQSLTLRDLFPEDRERILRRLARQNLEDLENRFMEIYMENKDLLKLLKEASIDPPPSLLLPAQSFLTKSLLRELDQWEKGLDPAGLGGIRSALSEAAIHGVPIDKSSVASSFTELTLEHVRLLGKRLDAATIESLLQFIEISDELGIEIQQHEIQNEIHRILQREINGAIAALDEDSPKDTGAIRTISSFLKLARRFNFNTDFWQGQLPKATQ